jgi:hypothetical protein
VLNADHVTDYWMRPCRKMPIEVAAVEMNEEFFADTASGRQFGKPGDYLIKGVDGEKYPCPKDVFEKSYKWAAEGTAETKLGVGVRVGRFKLDADQVFSNSPTISKILGAVEVSDAKFDETTGMITYMAESPLFDLTPPEQIAPMYHMYLVFERVVAECTDGITGDDAADAASFSTPTLLEFLQQAQAEEEWSDKIAKACNDDRDAVLLWIIATDHTDGDAV